MKLICISILFTLLNIISLHAANGDTTLVKGHNKAHLNWYGNFVEKVYFPTQGKSYHSVILKLTMGCPNAGCSDWDYTTQIFARNYTNDSTFQNIELARVITPYGGYLTKNWLHTWYFDVTDFRHFLEDSIELNAFYSGWSDGFLVSTDFIFIEGSPSREVLNVNLLAQGSFDYGKSSSTNKIEDKTAPKPIQINANAVSFKVRSTVTGHGFNGNGFDPGNPDNCAEFCKKWFRLLVDGTSHFQTQIWRDDCGKNPVYRQNGTWIYNRAGWCPGDVGTTYNFNTSTLFTPGQTHQIGFSWQNYSNTSPNNSSYTFSSYLIQYGNYNYQNEIALTHIKAPNNTANFNRINPACSNPVISIKNNGSDTLKSLTINYGLINLNNTLTHQWSGNLPPDETTDIQLTTNGWLLQANSQTTFFAELLNPNGKTDEFLPNNKMFAPFEQVVKTNKQVYLWLKTNNFSTENYYEVYNDAGNLLFTKTNLPANTSIRDTFNLPDGCYTIVLKDTDCDGLTFPFNNPPYVAAANAEGTGFAQLWEVGGGQIGSIDPNFGCETRLSFSLGTGFTGTIPPFTSVQNNLQQPFYVTIYPNPTQNNITIQLAQQTPQTQNTIMVYNMLGHLISQKELSGSFSSTTISLNTYGAGVYLVKISNNSGYQFQQKVLVY